MLPIVRVVFARWYGFYYAVPFLRETMDRISSGLASKLRLNFGDRIHKDVLAAYRPRFLLRLYEFENSDVCRQIREVMSVLDLDYICYPCPREQVTDFGDTVFREGRWRCEAQQKGGKCDLPLLVDPNTDSLVHTSDIIPYLWETYGPLCGELDVTVVEAKNLTNRPSGKNTVGGTILGLGCSRQAFAEVSLLGCPVPPLKTEVKPYTLDPNFNETFSYGVTSMNQSLQVTIKDKDYGWGENNDEQADAFMGRVVVHLSDVITAIALKQHLQMKAKEDKRANESQESNSEGANEIMAAAQEEEENQMLDKWYMLEEERPLLRRSGTSIPALGLLRLRFEYRPRTASADSMPWQARLLLDREDVPPLAMQVSKRKKRLWTRASDTLYMLLLLVLRHVSLVLASLARPLPEFGLARTPNRCADEARALALAETLAQNDDGTVDEKLVGQFLASLSDRDRSLRETESSSGVLAPGDSISMSSTPAKRVGRASRLLNVAQSLVSRLMDKEQDNMLENSSVSWIDEGMNDLPQLYTYESDPAGRRIREVLCTLELPYQLHNVAHGSRKSLPEDVDGGGKDKAKLPLFIDPATGFRSSEPGAVKEYLTSMHATGACKDEWIIVTVASYIRFLVFKMVQFLLLSSLRESSSFMLRLTNMLKEELVPFIREEVAWSVRETATAMGLANIDPSQSRGRVNGSPEGRRGTSRPRAGSRGPSSKRSPSPGRIVAPAGQQSSPAGLSPRRLVRAS